MCIRDRQRPRALGVRFRAWWIYHQSGDRGAVATHDFGGGWSGSDCSVRQRMYVHARRGVDRPINDERAVACRRAGRGAARPDPDARFRRSGGDYRPAVHADVPGDSGAVLRRRPAGDLPALRVAPVSYTHLRAHETPEHLVCRLLLEKKKTKTSKTTTLQTNTTT